MAEILIIEDDLWLLRSLARLFAQTRHKTRLTSNGQDAIKLMQQLPADLVITDILMPEMDGIEVIRTLRKEFPKTKIIAMSGGGQADPDCYLRIARELGVNKTFAKPFLPWDLLDAVEELCPPTLAEITGKKSN